DQNSARTCQRRLGVADFQDFGATETLEQNGLQAGFAARKCAPVVEPTRSPYYTARLNGLRPISSTQGRAVFETLKPLPMDAILGIMTLFRADSHAGKIDLSVGVYQDEQGRTPVLPSVKRAEQTILAAQ